MSDSTVVSSRLIGEIFVERGLVTRDQLEQALSIQARDGGMIGEILVASFGISRVELEEAGVLARSVVDARPPRVEYRLTEEGERLRTVLDALALFARQSARLPGGSRLPLTSPPEGL